MPESLVFSYAKILSLVSLLFVAVKDQSLLTFEILIILVIINHVAVSYYIFMFVECCN